MPQSPQGRNAQDRQNIRIPLVGVPNNRLADVSGGSSASSGVIGLGVIGSMIIGSGASGSSKDQRFINCVFDVVKNPVTGNQTTYVAKRPGFAAESTPAAGSIGTAIKVWTSQGSDKVISAFGSTNSTIYDSTTSKGAITGKARFIDEASVGGTPTLLIVSTDNTAWYYQDGGSPTKIVDADFPANNSMTITGRFVSVDGYNFIMATNGRIYSSDINSITAWTATKFLTAQAYPDRGIGLARYKNQIVAFGQETLEFYHITDTSEGIALARTEQAFTRIGCASQIGYSQFEDTVAWISAGDRGGASVYMLNDFKPQKISTAAIDIQLAIYGPANVKMNCIKIYGKTLIFAICGTTSYVYSVEDDIWALWNSQSCLWSDMSCSSGGTWKIYAVADSNTSGKVYSITPGRHVFQDDGINFTMSIQTSRVDGGTAKRKFLHKLTLIGDQQSSSAPVTVSCFDDDYNTSCDGRSVDLVNDRAYLTRLGYFRRRVFTFSNTSNTPLRLEGFEVEFTEGVN
jgi:hypothetical protein